MATTRRSSAATKKPKANEEPKLSAVEARNRVKVLEEKLAVYENTAYCPMCKAHKDKSTKFYVNTDPMFGGYSTTSICKECARKIALRVDKNGEEHSPTKDSVQLALRYLNKPFLETVWNASIQESENIITGKIKLNVWTSYIKNIQMPQYIGLTYFDSDFYKEKITYADEKTAEDVIKKHAGMDTYDSFLKNKDDVIRLLNYDPFEKEDVNDQPFLYSQLLGLLDNNEDSNDDMMRVSSSISIVRGFLQQAKIDDTIALLMSDYKQVEKNSATIKSLQDSKAKIVSTISSLAQDSCIALRYSKNSKKGENTWTGKLKKIKDLNLREGETNGFDLETCKAMKQVMDLSNESIIKALSLDESEWSDMVAEQREIIVNLQNQLDKSVEVARILLRENLDIKDALKEKNIDLEKDYVNLDDLFSPFADIENEDDGLIYIGEGDNK